MKYRYRIEEFDLEYIQTILDFNGVPNPTIEQDVVATRFKWLAGGSKDSFCFIEWRERYSFTARVMENLRSVPTPYPFFVNRGTILTRYGSLIRGGAGAGHQIDEIRMKHDSGRDSRLMHAAAATGVQIWENAWGTLQWEGMEDGVLWESFDPHTEPLTQSEYLDYLISCGKTCINTNPLRFL